MGWDYLTEYYAEFDDEHDHRELLGFGMNIMGACGDEKYSIRIYDHLESTSTVLYGTDESNWRTVSP